MRRGWGRRRNTPSRWRHITLELAYFVVLLLLLWYTVMYSTGLVNVSDSIIVSNPVHPGCFSSGAYWQHKTLEGHGQVTRRVAVFDASALGTARLQRPAMLSWK